MKVLVKSGNGSAVHLPKKVLKAAGLEADQRLAIKIDGQSITINPVDLKKELERFLEQITPENLHDEVSFGVPVGKEAF